MPEWTIRISAICSADDGVGFDFIINSQVLWGDCDTLDALAIYQLIRPGNAKFVTVMPYLWNGKKKELLEREEEVEQRGAEIGQQ